MISCITITQAGREAMVADAMADFAQQTVVSRELLIVHDGNSGLHERLAHLADSHAAKCKKALIRVERAETGLSLGALRNIATDHAEGEWICQWDDDDRYHPERLRLQWQAAQNERADCCFLVDQLHWFRQTGALFWDDWNNEPYPMNFVQGTLLCKRARMPRYPELRRGEDTAFTWDLLRASHDQGFNVARLRGVGWCYIYSYHGANAWDAAHHEAIAAAKHWPAARLIAQRSKLSVALSEYVPRMPPLSMQCGAELWQF